MQRHNLGENSQISEMIRDRVLGSNMIFRFLIDFKLFQILVGYLPDFEIDQKPEVHILVDFLRFPVHFSVIICNFFGAKLRGIDGYPCR